MKTETVKKPTDKVAGEQPKINGSTQPVVTSPATVKKEEDKTALKQVNAIERILNDLEVLNSRKENREHLLESQRKLKAFNPTVTESGCKLTIEDRGNKFQTTHSEALKLVIGNYVAIVERKLNEVEDDIKHLAQKLAA